MFFIHFDPFSCSLCGDRTRIVSWKAICPAIRRIDHILKSDHVRLFRLTFQVFRPAHNHFSFVRVVGVEPTQVWYQRCYRPLRLSNSGVLPCTFNSIKKPNLIFTSDWVCCYIIMFFNSLLYTHNASDRWYCIPRFIHAYGFDSYCYVSNCCHFFYFLNCCF